MKKVCWLALNIFRVNFRKRITFIIFFILPVCGIAFSFVINDYAGSGLSKIAVIDYDHSFLSKDVARSLNEAGQFRITAMKSKEMQHKIISGEIDCALIIPAGFAESIYRRQIPKISLVSVQGQAAAAWIKNYLQAVLVDLQDIGTAAGGNAETFNKIYRHYQQEQHSVRIIQIADQTANKGMTTKNIGFLIMLMMFGVGNTSELILKEKRNRTYHRICAAPVTARAYLISNVLANLSIVIIQVLLALLIMTGIFGIITYVPFMQLFIILVLFGLIAIALGLVVVSFSKDTPQASTMQNLIVTPTCLLAGCLWPSEVMPQSIQRIAGFLPQRWVIVAVQKLQDGMGFDQVLTHIGTMIAFATALFLIAAWRFNRNNELKTFI
jgi:ABC-2 type transport system permease protein